MLFHTYKSVLYFTGIFSLQRKKGRISERQWKGRLLKLSFFNIT